MEAVKLNEWPNAESLKRAGHSGVGSKWDYLFDGQIWKLKTTNHNSQRAYFHFLAKTRGVRLRTRQTADNKHIIVQVIGKRTR